MTDVIAQLILAFAALVVAAIVVGYAWCCGVFAVAPRRAKHLAAQRAALTATVTRPIQSSRPLPVTPAPAILEGRVVEPRRAQQLGLASRRERDAEAPIVRPVNPIHSPDVKIHDGNEQEHRS